MMDLENGGNREGWRVVTVGKKVGMTEKWFGEGWRRRGNRWS
jgi:hypothetical protein